MKRIILKMIEDEDLGEIKEKVLSLRFMGL